MTYIFLPLLQTLYSCIIEVFLLSIIWFHFQNLSLTVFVFTRENLVNTYLICIHLITITLIANIVGFRPTILLFACYSSCFVSLSLLFFELIFFIITFSSFNQVGSFTSFHYSFSGYLMDYNANILPMKVYYKLVLFSIPNS